MHDNPETSTTTPILLEVLRRATGPLTLDELQWWTQLSATQVVDQLLTHLHTGTVIAAPDARLGVRWTVADHPTGVPADLPFPSVDDSHEPDLDVLLTSLVAGTVAVRPNDTEGTVLLRLDAQWMGALAAVALTPTEARLLAATLTRAADSIPTDTTPPATPSAIG